MTQSPFHLALIASTVIVLAACGDDDTTAEPAADEPSETVDVEGAIHLRPHEDLIGVGGMYEVGSECDGQARTGSNDLFIFGDDNVQALEAGAQVVVKDGSGETLATGELGPGEWVRQSTGTNLSDHVCEMPFTAGEVPASEFYEVTVGDETVTVPADEAGDFEIIVESRS